MLSIVCIAALFVKSSFGVLVRLVPNGIHFSMSDAYLASWSARITKKLPNARVVGRLADSPGVLLLCEANATSGELDYIERCLMHAGIGAWHWQVDSPHTLKIRAYERKSRTGALIWLLPVVFLAAAYLRTHDIHSFISSAQRWLGVHW